MRIVKYTSRFRRDYERESSGQLSKRLDAMLLETGVTGWPRARWEPRRTSSAPFQRNTSIPNRFTERAL
jgi:hypothetical protein